MKQIITSNKEFGSTVIIHSVGVDIRVSNNYVTAKVDDNGLLYCQHPPTPPSWSR